MSTVTTMEGFEVDMCICGTMCPYNRQKLSFYCYALMGIATFLGSPLPPPPAPPPRYCKQQTLGGRATDGSMSLRQAQYKI